MSDFFVTDTDSLDRVTKERDDLRARLAEAERDLADARERMGVQVAAEIELRAQLEQEQAGAAAMREALERMAERLSNISETEGYDAFKVLESFDADMTTALANSTAGAAYAARVAVMRAVLVYARDCLAHTAKFAGTDWPLLRKAIVKVLGEPAPAVGSTFQEVLALTR